MSKSHTMNFLHAFRDSLSFWDTNLNQLLLQQLATTGGGGGGGGGGNNHPREGSIVVRARLARVPQPELRLKCPRCASKNTKFCYFNNYSLTQPRHLCRDCRRTWTRGGALRNVSVGPRRVQPPRQAKCSTKPEATAEHQND